MAQVGQIYYNVMDNTNNGYTSHPNNFDIFSDIVVQYGANRFNKIGVQAPPGTKVIMNEDKTIIVGRTGIYELDDDIAITKMRFNKPRRYIKDEQASLNSIKAGTEGMLAADAAREAAIKQLSIDYPNIPVDENDPNYLLYWDRYNTIQATYIEAYEEALGLYNTGINGIYILPNPNNVDAPENYQDLYNIIVDFIYE